MRVLDVGKGVKPESRARGHGEQTHRSPLVHLGCARAKRSTRNSSFPSSVVSLALFVFPRLSPIFARSRGRAVATRIARSALARTDLLLDGRPAGHRSTLGKSSHRLTRARGAARHRSSNSRRQHRARGRQRLTRSIDGVGEGSIGGASNRRVVTGEECLSRDNAPTILASQPTKVTRKRRASRPSRPSSFVLFVLDFSPRRRTVRIVRARGVGTRRRRRRVPP